MRKLRKIIPVWIILFIFWIGFTLQDFTLTSINVTEIVVGLVISLLVSALTSLYLLENISFKFRKEGALIGIIRFIPIYLLELIYANIDVAKKALSKDIDVSPGIIKYKTDLESDMGLYILSNSITLTPGTITMDIYEEDLKTNLYIHCIDVKDKQGVINGIKNKLENNIRRFLS
ncbi:Na+/H+ antiporter subunit E [Clostridium sardiniense]